MDEGFCSVITASSELILTIVWRGGGGQISTLGSVNPFFPSLTRTGFSVRVCQTRICEESSVETQTTAALVAHCCPNVLIPRQRPLTPPHRRLMLFKNSQFVIWLRWYIPHHRAHLCVKSYLSIKPCIRSRECFLTNITRAFQPGLCLAAICIGLCLCGCAALLCVVLLDTLLFCIL